MNGGSCPTILPLILCATLVEFGHTEYVMSYISDLPLVSRWKRQSCNNQFSCASGECISESLVCDGERNCKDRSDETSETCLQRLLPALALHLEPPLISFVDKCSSSQFACNYGKCVELSKRCNGHKDCVDGSDEESCDSLGSVNSTSSKNPTEPTQPTVQASNCKLPEYPANGRYHIIACDQSPCGPGTVATRNAVLQFGCEKGFELTSDSFVWCNGSSWSSTLPICQKAMCPPLENPTRKIHCLLFGKSVDCSKDMEPGTQALASCNDYYTASPELFSDSIFCKEDGEWSNVIHSCKPECGMPSVAGKPFIAGGFNITTLEVPWHVAIFREHDNKTLEMRCGGSIIRPDIVISAAHCFWDEIERKLENVNRYKLVAGKNYRDWYKQEEESQLAEIRSIVIHPDFTGFRTNFAEDIAIVFLNRSLSISEKVKPICLDTKNKYPTNFDDGGVVGIVAGWGYTEEQVLSEELKGARLPVWDKRTCLNSLPDNINPFAAHRDKFCAGSTKNISVCQGDSGGGFGVQFGNHTPYFLMGIVSAGVASPHVNCDFTKFAIFTKISAHIPFIEKHLTQSN